jgi:paired amphipathic helix protein Sin3a
MEFKDRPQIYNQFLAIMKNFKTQEVDTPGVIRRVSQLFRGYNSLILGFNTFLPEGFKISLADLKRQELEDLKEEEEAERRRQLLSALPEHAPARGSPQAGPVGPGSQSAQGANGGQWTRKTGPLDAETRKSLPKPAGAQSHRTSQQSKQPYSGTKAAKPAAASGTPSTHPPQASQHQAVEFDHAISYVTKIKRRFANDASTYHSFLEILHTYQKEQRGIKEVLEQVAHLFQDHPDLLKEFTFFLPDAVQEQAKERLHRAAAESEARQAVSRQQQMEMEQYHGMVSPAHSKFIDMTRSGQAMEMDTSSRRKRVFADGSVHPDGASQPETYVYNSAVERQFFDMARESLTSYTRDGGQAWAEFSKCLDMYAQDILSRSDMLNFVEPLLGKRNTKLFEEFKRILNAAGSTTHPLPLTEDSWHSVPLSEIDFSRCRRCSPSYRALPRDYPAPPCSGRSEEEAQVLNDMWVSLPVGSEESYTFRHMRRNTYEETLFRVEDERFEIDMAIDTNASTLRRLESIAEEIAQLAQEELVSHDPGAKSEGTGLGGRRFQYTFDKKLLGVINRNAIARIYGDSGQEMLDLLVKNPTAAVPIVVQRLRQKDREWRAVRDRLNRHWKELAQHNYYKSLDHRSLTWRTFDKRATSARTLLSEIKDRAGNGGSEGHEALKQKMDKAKEEHGTFYEVTMGETLSKQLDLTFLPKPDRRLFTPHLSLMYENNSWAQRDAYRMLSFALERGHISPADKERCHRLWTEFLGPFFGLSMNWMQRPAVSYQESTATTAVTSASLATSAAPVSGGSASVVSEDDDEDSMEEDAAPPGNVVTEEIRQDSYSSKEFADHHPLPRFTHVSTLYGEGKVIEFRRSDHVYVVDLGFGARGYLRPATVLCSMVPVEKSAFTEDLRSKDVSKLTRPDDHLVIGTQNLYLFFRLHQILIRRLNIAKRLAYSVGEDPSLQTLVEQMPDTNPNAVGRRRYEAYLTLVYSLLDGGGGGAAEGGKYEDRVRGLLGHGAYELATMDKLISHIWKNIQALAGEETTWSLIQLYRRQLADGGFKPESFRQEAIYHSDGEPMYAFQYCPVQGKDTAVLHFEYLGVMENSEGADEVMDDEDEGEPDEIPEPKAKRIKR